MSSYESIPDQGSKDPTNYTSSARLTAQKPSPTASGVFKWSWVLCFVGTEVMATMWNLFFLDYLANVVGLPAIDVGTVATFMRVFDAITDPVVGSMSDRFGGVFGLGRRRGYIILAFVPFALTWLLQFIVPPFTDQASLLVYYIILTAFANWLWTCVYIPLVALLNEFCKDDQERTMLNTARFIGTGLGAAVSTGGQAAIFATDMSEKKQFAFIATIFASTFVLLIVNLLYQGWDLREEDASVVDRSWSEAWKKIVAIFRVKEYITVALLYVCSLCTMQFSIAMLPFFIQQYMLYTRTTVTAVIGVGLASGFLFLVPVIIFSKKGKFNMEKRTMYFIGASIWMGFFLLLPAVSVTNSVDFICSDNSTNTTFVLQVDGKEDASSSPCGGSQDDNSDFDIQEEGADRKSVV